MFLQGTSIWKIKKELQPNEWKLNGFASDVIYQGMNTDTFQILFFSTVLYMIQQLQIMRIGVPSCSSSFMER